MQTFLPDPRFERSAALLDDRRLGKQRVEALQVLRALGRTTGGWIHHPAVRMWRGHEEALVRYGLEVCEEWRRRGFADTCADKLRIDLMGMWGLDRVRTQDELAQAGDLPAWLGDERVHRSHRSSLASKDPEFYGSHFPDAIDEPYFWPSVAERDGCSATGRRRGRRGLPRCDSALRASRARSRRSCERSSH